MERTDGLILALALDGKGGGRPLAWNEIAPRQGGDETLWIHLDREHPAAEQWLREDSGLEEIAVDALLADETRPRSVSIGSGQLVILRGVNLNPGADPEDMVSVRLWLDATRVITVRARRLIALQDIGAALARGEGPCRPGDFLAELSHRLVERMEPVIESLDETVDELEDSMLHDEVDALRERLSEVRQQAIKLRRHLAPQREALARLLGETRPWLEPDDKGRLREAAERVTRYLEDLDAIRERGSVIQDEVMNRLSQRMNRTMYMLSVVATVILPLSFVTGLLGVNVGGIPGASHPWGFAIVVLLLAAVGVLEVWLFRRLKWI
jgi:zinc transporter